jgi:hypothetical protein
VSAGPAGPLRVDEAATRALAERAASIRREHAAFEAARRLARGAGAHQLDGFATFAAWLPHRTEPGTRVELETIDPLGPVPFDREATVRVVRQRLPMVRDGAWAYLAVAGARPGSRERAGTFYRFVVTRPDGREELHGDPLAASLPFGLFGPAELYDVERLRTERADAEFFRRFGIGGEDEGGQPPRFGPPAHVLQVHVGTATHGGTLGDLADLYRALADKVRAGEAPTPAERVFLGYDAIQLMPVEPVIENPADPSCFVVEGEPGAEAARLRRPATIDWGYDTAIFGAAAVSPALLRSGRPDELVDLAAVLHTFPGKPMRLFLDVVFGHADAQGAQLLPDPFFLGPNMYGLDLDFREPTVRALLLEMQRRKVDYGADGLRVDAAQDHKVLDEASGRMVHDDAYLREMSAVVQEVAGVRYRPFMIFEDGRPWPREDWRTASTYLDVIRDQPHAFQWGPLTFAHNTPCLEGFWSSVWWRVEEIADHGGHWIGGCANHDTLRRGYQIPPEAGVNRRLGRDLPEILRRSYDHPAADLLFYGLLPGVPMTFVAAAMGAPWAFMRNADHRWAVKVAAEEAGVFTWRFGEAEYGRDDAFPRLKELGLHDHAAAAGLFLGLRTVVEAGATEADEVAAAARAAGVPAPFDLEPEALRRAARAFMEDLHDACVVWRTERRLDPAWVDAALELRRVRLARPWLRADMRTADAFGRHVREDGGTLVHGIRHAPDGGESVALIANLEGEPWTVAPRELLGEGDWHPLLLAPGVAWHGPDAPLELRDAEGVLLHVTV